MRRRKVEDAIFIVIIFLILSSSLLSLTIPKILKDEIVKYLIAGEEIDGHIDITRGSKGELILSHTSLKGRFTYLFIFDLDGRYRMLDLGFSKDAGERTETVKLDEDFLDEVVFVQILFSDRKIDFQIGDVMDAIYAPLARTGAKVEYLWKILFPKGYSILTLKIPEGVTIRTDYGIFSSGMLKIRLPFGIHEIKVMHRGVQSCTYNLVIMDGSERYVEIPRKCGSDLEMRKAEEDGRYSSLFILSRPYTEIRVNGEFFGYTNEYGYLKVDGLKTGKVILELRKRGFRREERYFFLNEGVNCLQVELVKLSKINIVSKVVPYRVFVDGEYYGTVYSNEEVLNLPSGLHRLRFENFKMYTLNVERELKDGDRIVLNFRELPFGATMDLYLNERKRIVIGITVTKDCDCVFKVMDENGTVVYEKRTRVHSGINKMVWKPRRNGGYIVSVDLKDGEKTLSMEKEIQVRNIPTMETELPRFFMASLVTSIIGAILAVFISSLR